MTCPSKPKRDRRLVYCRDCRHSEEYRSILSRTVDTGECFMVTCCIGDAKRDTARLNFKNVPRECEYYVPKEQ